ncbi:hypothetical protein [Marivivens donghaensis]|jgi:hypothetical protein|uniref:hypothetical protein n=1 Tax=Marivivens donghaensis TaxID=1699413 RepID=UPI003F69B3E9
MTSRITEEDLSLLSTSDEEIKKQNQEWSFDCDKFRAAIKTGERWHQLVQSQIYLEHIVAQILRDAIPFPDEISFSRMPFGPRLDLARALDLIPSDITVAARLISKMRNRVAHNLSFEITDHQVKDLENCIPSDLKKIIKEDNERPVGPLQFSELLEVIVLVADIHRQSRLANMLLSRKAEIRLRTTLDKTPGARYVK